jgi:farnesyl diphosphate synthase
MVGGQMLDLAAEGRFDGKLKQLGEEDVRLLQSMKTGALLRFGCLAGAMLGEANADQRAALDRYGSVLGEAFQIADDLLDVEGDAATVGKATGKDANAQKATFVSILGLDPAKVRLKNLVAEAEAALAPFGAKGDVLKMAARFVAERKA